MKVLVTGGHGFVGQYLQRELQAAGHEVIALPHEALDVVDGSAVEEALAHYAPDAIAHLAGIAFGHDVERDPVRAFAVAVAGTANIMESARHASKKPIVLVTGSADVYGSPQPEDLPISEDAAVRPRSPYGISKLAQESVALALAGRYGVTVIVTRAFNHSGAGQRPVFVLPAIASRVYAVAQGHTGSVAVGNLGVLRDFTHVLDVVRAYRLLLEAAADGQLAPGPTVVNVASGRAIAISDLLEQLCQLAGVAPSIHTDPSLMRRDDPPEIRGDATSLRRLTGWHPEHTIEEMVQDAWAAASPPSE